MFKKIGRIVKSVIKGSLKSLPLMNIKSELDLEKIKSTVNQLRGARTENESELLLKKIFDLADDGKINDSYNQRKFDKFIELAVNLIVVGSALIAIIN